MKQRIETKKTKLRPCWNRENCGSRGERVMEGIVNMGFDLIENLVLYRMTPFSPFQDYQLPIYRRVNLVKICILDQI